jgi:hypothetical protein
MNLSRREFCEAAVATGAALRYPEPLLRAASTKAQASELPGSWPVPRQNRYLTSIQPLAGRMTAAPAIGAEIELQRVRAVVTAIAPKPGAGLDRAVAIENGRLRGYRLDGSLLGQTHPPGLNFQSMIAAEDLNGDGRVEPALMAGRPLMSPAPPPVTTPRVGTNERHPLDTKRFNATIPRAGRVSNPSRSVSEPYPHRRFNSGKPFLPWNLRPLGTPRGRPPSLPSA